MPTVAEAVVDRLYEAGIRHVFGLPGGETVHLLEALRRKGVQFHLVHNESSALFMADAYARISGVPGICLTTLGPGATNATVGIAHAFLDRAPVILITAQKPDHLLPDYTHQVIDLHALFAPITKATWRLQAHNAVEYTLQALALAQEGRPGPVHLQLSNEDAALIVTEVVTEAGSSTDSRQPALVDPAMIDQARTLLAAAHKPLIVAGLGLEPQRPYAAIRALAETIGAPVVVTPKAKGALPDDSPLAAGVIGLTQTDAAYAIIDEADCIIALGFDVVELVKPWRHTVPFIWLAPWSNHNPTLEADVDLIGDMAPILYELCEVEIDRDPHWPPPSVLSTESSIAPNPPVQGRIYPQTVLDIMRRTMDRDTVLAVDVGSHKILSSLAWPTLTPNCFLLSNGLSSMGYALPAAIGASLAQDHAPTVCLTGDAGFAMVMGELGLVRRMQLPVTIVVLNDGAIDLIRAQQVRSGNPVFGTEFFSPEFHKIADAYGIFARRTQTADEFDVTYTTALRSGQPALIEVMLDPASYPTTPRPNPKPPV